jgi:hypothetical protein
MTTYHASNVDNTSILAKYSARRNARSCKGCIEKQPKRGCKTNVSGRRYRYFCSTIVVIPYDLRLMRTIAPLMSTSKVELDVLLHKRERVRMESI